MRRTWGWTAGGSAAVVAIACLAALGSGLAPVGTKGTKGAIQGAAHGNAARSPATVRAARRAYDGAPPVIPHAPMGADCIACHNAQGVAVPELGFAPPSPHELTAGFSAASRCVQCHVYRATEELFVATSFQGLRQDLRRGSRHHAWAPPVRPHPRFLRENCQACHAGPAAREEIRTTHPERARCEQCHLAAETDARFVR